MMYICLSTIPPTVLGGDSPNLVGSHLGLELPSMHPWVFKICSPMACYSLSPPQRVYTHLTVLGGASSNLVEFHSRFRLLPWHH